MRLKPIGLFFTFLLPWSLTGFANHDDAASGPGAAAQVADRHQADPPPEQPYWYQPGHPLNPAEATAITALAGFEVDKFFAVPERFGSWTAISSDERGRLICAAQHQPGLYRITL